MTPEPQPDLFGSFYAGSAPRLPMDEWVEQHRVVVGGARPGRWDARNGPMSVEPMRALCDDRVRQVWVVSPAQLLKTEFMINAALWATWYGEDVLFFEPALDLVETMIADRVRPAAMHLRGLEQMMAGQAHKKRDTKTELRLPSGGTIVGLTPAMKTGDAARSAPIVLFDELDKMGRTDLIAVGEARTRTYGDDGKVAGASTPTEDKNGTIWRVWSEGSAGVWHGHCPHCGELAGMGWGAVALERDANGLWRPESAVMSCDRCGTEWSETDRVAAARAGRYVHADPDNPVRTFRIPGCAHLFTSLDFIVRSGAREYRAMVEELDASGYVKWTNESLAEPWRDDHMGLSSRSVKRASYAMGAKGEDDLGELDERALIVTAGTDVGGNAIYTEWVAWGVDPETRNILSWGLQYRVVGGSPEDSIDDMELWAEYDGELRSSVWRMPFYPGQRFGAWRVLIDSGWGERSDLVRQFCTTRYADERRATGERQIHPFGATVLPLKSQSMGEDRYERPVVLKPPVRQRGKAVQVPCLVIVMSQQLKDIIHQSVFRDGKLPEGEPKSNRWPTPPEPFGYTDQWRMEFANFKMETVRNPRSKTVERHWIPRVQSRPEEALDCRVYALAAAHVVTAGQPLQHGLLRMARKEARREGSRWSDRDRRLLDDAVAELDGARGRNVVELHGGGE